MLTLNYYISYLVKLDHIRHSIENIRDSYIENKPWDREKDIRFSFFNQLYRLVISYDLGMVDHVEKLGDNTKVKGLFGPDNTDEILSDYFRFLKNAFIYSYTGIVENYFRSIARAIPGTGLIPTNFRDIKNLVSSRLGLNQDSEYWRALLVLSTLRNCIHNNGIFFNTRKTETDTFYNKRRHLFINNEPHQSADPDTLLAIVNDTLSLIQQINEHDKILSFPHIPDPSYQQTEQINKL